ncbi:type IV secretion protein IcmB [bacterium]|nr:type IV secretion protein IcmB [bacterium]NBX72513.1 type IV secretion protein IcmB [bacterium]
MSKSTHPLFGTIDSFLGWLNESLGQSVSSYCDLETAESRYNLVATDGSLVSIFRVNGSTKLVGPEEYEKIMGHVHGALKTGLSQPGYNIQVYFEYDEKRSNEQIANILQPSINTAERLQLDLEDLFEERQQVLQQSCHFEQCYFVIWTLAVGLTGEQSQIAVSEKAAGIKKNKYPYLKYSQNLIAAIPQLRESHQSFVKILLNEMQTAGLHCELLDVYQALNKIRSSVDYPATSYDWQAFLPGDKLTMRFKEENDISSVFYPPLSQQLFPRDGEIIDLRTVRVGDLIYSTATIDIFPKDIKPFQDLFSRLQATKIPWRISYQLQSGGIKAMGIKPALAGILSFAGSYNKMISDVSELLRRIEVSSDEAVIQLRVGFTTWAECGDPKLLRARMSEMIKAVQAWGYCEIAEYSGDSFASFISTSLGLSKTHVADCTSAPLYEACTLLPVTRPTSTWTYGSIVFRSPDGKPLLYQPGSPQQTTWIDLIYARPGSGKSVLSNALNLGLSLQAGIIRLPRIAIVDIGPSSSGLISLLKESLPVHKRHYVSYHRMRMTPEYSINPFDTQLGSRFPTPQERGFLVNFLSLLCTPVGMTKPYDGISDMCGMIVDELFKIKSDQYEPTLYARGMMAEIDSCIDQLPEARIDERTSWWEITDMLFHGGFIREAYLCQRLAVPLLADSVQIARSSAVADLYGTMKAPTGETLVSAFSRMISAAVREYPILSRITAFDLGEGRVISLDLDEVAKSGGETADRQTAIMYMIARFILAKDYYLSADNLNDFPTAYHGFHGERIREIREDAKRIVFDEFHRTSKAQAVRNQVLMDMREGRKWKVQVCLLSQALDDFDKVMVEFGTSIFILDAGPKTAIEKSVSTFGLSATDEIALSTRVHGPRAGGATLLAQFATKSGIYTQLYTLTLGPIELWAFNTTSEDAYIRNALYLKIGPKKTRQLLAKLFPSGSAASVVVERLENRKGKATQQGLISDPEKEKGSILEEMVAEILEYYKKNQKS